MKNLILGGGVLAAALTGAAQLQAAPKMNVIYILADDLGYGDLGCTGQKKFTTPNIDRLAAQGMLFTQHYSGSTVSAPSRSALMTGQHTGHTWIRGNREMPGQEGQLPLPAGTYTIPAMFKKAGYVTGAFGKWGLGFPGSEGDPVNQGFDEFYGYNCQREAHRYYPQHLWHNTEKVILEGNKDYRRGEYSQDLIHAQCMAFVEANRSKPFFLFMPYVLPHAELIVPEDELIGRYRGVFKEVPYEGIKGSAYGPDMSVTAYCPQPEPYATFAAMIARLDQYVGDLMDKLTELGLDKNTIVMFSSDNGPHREGGANPDFFDSYGPFRGVKRDLYEGGIRLPLIAWAPGKIQAGVKNDHICASWDMLPTFAAIAGAKIPASVRTDGLSILPTLTGKGKQKQHEYLYWEFHEQGGKLAVRMGDWKGIMLNATKDKNPSIALYDLSKDIHEDNDVAARHPEVVAKIREIFKAAHTDSKIFQFNSPSLYI